MRHVALALSLIALVAIAGCSKEPASEIDAAKQSLAAAESARAADYAPDSWAKATDADARLQAELKAQQERTALFRSYGHARELAVEVKETADRAAGDAVAGEQRVKNEASELMAQARARTDEATKLLESAPTGKGTAADLATLKSDAASIATTLDEMQKAFDSGDYPQAKAKAQAAITAADEIKAAVENARSMGTTPRRV